MIRALVSVAFIAALAAGSFFVTQEWFVESAEPPSVDEAVEVLDEDRLALRADTTVAGLTIVPLGGEEYAYDTHCSKPQWDEWGGVDAGFSTGNETDIAPIPGFDIVDHQVAWCDGRVAFNSLRMVSPSEDATVTVVRVLADPVLHKDIPAERVTEVTVSGRPAVHVTPIVLGDGFSKLSSERLYVVEDFGITNISVEGRVDIFDIALQVLGTDR